MDDVKLKGRGDGRGFRVERKAMFEVERGTIFCNLRVGGGTEIVESEEGLGRSLEVIKLKSKQKGILWGEYERDTGGKGLCGAVCDVKEVGWDWERGEGVFVSFRIFLFGEEKEEEEGGEEDGGGGEEGTGELERSGERKNPPLETAFVDIKILTHSNAFELFFFFSSVHNSTITLSCNGKTEVVSLSSMPLNVWICISMKSKVDLSFLSNLAIRGEIVEVIGVESVLFDTMIISPVKVPLELSRNPSIKQEDLTLLLDLKSAVRRDLTRVRESLRSFQNRPPFFSDHCYAWYLWIREIFYCLWRFGVFTFIFFLVIIPIYTVKWVLVSPVKKLLESLGFIYNGETNGGWGGGMAHTNDGHAHAHANATPTPIDNEMNIL